MAPNSTLSSLKKQISELQKERQAHADAIEAIDQFFASLGGEAPAAAPKRGRPKGSSNKKATTAKKVTKKRGKGKRGSFGVSGEDAVIAFVKANKGCTTAQVNAYWIGEGRKGKADNALGKLTRDKKIKRTPIKGKRGSTFSA